MKTIITSITLLFLSFIATGQTWCDAGANWKYSYTNGFGTEGFVDVKYAGDTIISGQPAKVLDKHIYAYNYISSQSIENYFGQEYTMRTMGLFICGTTIIGTLFIISMHLLVRIGEWLSSQ